MRLYFFRIEGEALSCVEAEARETPKLYIATQGTFPNYLSRLPKERIGHIDDRWLVLDWPGVTTARAVWRQYMMDSAALYERHAKESLKQAEKCRRIAAALDETFGT